MGKAANIAKKAFFDTEGTAPPMFVFTEDEFDRFVHFFAKEQKIICGQTAREVTGFRHELSELAGDLVESCESVEV